MAVLDLCVLLTLYIKKSTERCSNVIDKLSNSRNPTTCDKIKQLLSLHFSNPLISAGLIQDFQRLQKLPQEFQSAQNTRNCSRKLLTDSEPKPGEIMRTDNSNSVFDAYCYIKHELQLSYFKNQKLDKSVQFRPIQNPQKMQ